VSAGRIIRPALSLIRDEPVSGMKHIRAFCERL